MLGWKIIQKILYTLRKDDPDENNKSTLNNREAQAQLSSLVHELVTVFLSERHS